MDDASELAGRSSVNTTPKKTSTGQTAKTKKIIQFRKRDTEVDSSQISPGEGEKDLINLALEKANSTLKTEGIESENRDMMDNESDAGSYHEPIFEECGSVDNADTSVGYSAAARESEKARLEAETEMLRVKTNKLKLQVKYLRNELSKQELEKEKLRLEIVLLKARIGMSEMR